MQRVDISNFKNQKTALVMSGGVVKAAAWHLGVALALEELGFSLKNNQTPQGRHYEISTYVGSSAGALVSLYFASGFGPQDIIQSYFGKHKSKKLRAVTYADMLSIKRPQLKTKGKFFHDPYQNFPPLIKNILRPILSFPGLFTTQGLKNYILKNIIEDRIHFQVNKADLFIVATQLDHSRKVIFSKYHYPNPGHDSTSIYYSETPVADAVSASMSVPPFYTPYPIKNSYTKQVDYYIDGEIRETLSTHVASDNKCKFIISSWTHTPYHYHDEIGSLVNYGLPSICLQAIYLMIQKKIVTSRARHHTAADIIRTIHEYMKIQKFSKKHIDHIIKIIEIKLNFNPHVHYIDIYPKHDNYKLFFKNSFSLDPAVNAEIVKMAKKRTLEIFQNNEWES